MKDTEKLLIEYKKKVAIRLQVLGVFCIINLIGLISLIIELNLEV